MARFRYAICPGALDTACHAGDASPDLLEVLHAASKAEDPVLELLRQADHLRWPILAVLAASHPDASASRCMAVWLRATLRLEGKPLAPLDSIPLTWNASLDCYALSLWPDPVLHCQPIHSTSTFSHYTLSCWAGC